MTTHDRWFPPGDGWVEYDGSGCPVNLKAKVEIATREFHAYGFAESMNWEHRPEIPGNIVAYRVVKEV